MNLSNFSNVSVDLSLDYKPNNNWRFQFLNRYFWLKNGVNRYFWFVEVEYKRPLTSWVGVSQTVRLHEAFDIEIADPDFVRSITHLNFPQVGKFKPFIGMDLFFRIDNINQLQRSRFKLGGTWSISKQIKWNVQIWKQDLVNQTSKLTRWILVHSFNYRLKEKSSDVKDASFY